MVTGPAVLDVMVEELSKVDDVDDVNVGAVVPLVVEELAEVLNDIPVTVELLIPVDSELLMVVESELIEVPVDV